MLDKEPEKSHVNITVMSKDKSIKKENNKKEPVKNLKEKRADKKAKQEAKKRES